MKTLCLVELMIKEAIMGNACVKYGVPFICCYTRCNDISCLVVLGFYAYKRAGDARQFLGVNL